MLKELIIKNRSYRRFDQTVELSETQLLEWVDLARLSASAGNLQPLKFFIANQPEVNELIFKNLSWAGYLTDWAGPVGGERPSAYIIILNDRKINESYQGCDHGIAAQSILLGAVAAGFGGCILGAVKRPELHEALHLSSERFDILVVLALGKPRETVVLEELKDSNVKYWRDTQQVHHVPKRSLAEIVVKPGRD